MSDRGPHEEHEEQQEQQDREQRQSASGRTPLTELYERMSRTFRENLEHAGTLTEDAFERALRETREWAGRFREHYAEDITRVSEFIRRDWYAGIRYTREQTRRSLDFDRLQAGVLGAVSRLAKTAGAQLEQFASRINDRLTYKTGEIAGAGTLQCLGCGQSLVFDQARRIPPCPKCHTTTFRRSF